MFEHMEISKGIKGGKRCGEIKRDLKMNKINFFFTILSTIFPLLD
jgi:hypothetical protein